MKNSIYLFLKAATIISLALLLNSCSDIFTQPNNIFQGQDQVVFKPTTNTVDARPDKNAEPVKVSPTLQLISSKGTLDSDISIEFSIDDSSTATAGIDYTITTPSPVTIASGKVSTPINIEVT